VDRLKQFLSEVDTIGRHELGEILGEGGMGVVYSAWDPKLERSVAIKVLKNGDPERVRLEAVAAARLDHPGIVRVHEVGPNYIVMDLISGPTLAAAFSALSIPQRLTLIRQIAEAVGHAHQRGIVHRDLKPGNVILRDGVQPVLTDFGLAHVLTDDLSESRAAAGTAPYMSPEQVEGKEATPASDVWSLGVLLYEAITVRVPFSGPNLYQVQNAIVTAEPVLPEHPARDILRKALAKKPTDRFPDGNAFAEALSQLGGETAATRTKAIVSVTWIALIVIGSVATIGLYYRRHSTTPAAMQSEAATVPASGMSPEKRFEWYSELENALTRFIAERKPDPELYYRRASIRVGRGDDARDHGRTPFADWDAAASDFDRALSLRPDHAEAKLGRGVLRAQICAHKQELSLDPTADCISAETDLASLTQTSLRSNTWRGNARMHHALWLRSQGDLEAATRLLSEAERDLSRVDDADTLARRARVRAALGKHAESDRDFEEAVKRGGLGAWLWTWWGIEKRRTGELAAAEEKLSRAISINAEHADAWAQRGHVRFEQGRYSEARTDFESAIAHNAGLRPALAERLLIAQDRSR